MFQVYFVNNLDFGFKIVGISIGAGVGGQDFGYDGKDGRDDDRDGEKVEIGGFVYEGGKVDSAWEFSSKNGNKFQKLPPVKCIIYT